MLDHEWVPLGAKHLGKEKKRSIIINVTDYQYGLGDPKSLVSKKNGARKNDLAIDFFNVCFLWK